MDYEEENKAIVMKVVEALQSTDPKLNCITEENIKRGLKERLPCRMEELRQ